MERVQSWLIEAPLLGATTHATVHSSHEVYTCDLFWLSLLLTSFTVLLVIEIFGIVLKWRTLAPDMIGYVTGSQKEEALLTRWKGRGFSKASKSGLETFHLTRMSDIRPLRWGALWRLCREEDTTFDVGYQTVKRNQKLILLPEARG